MQRRVITGRVAALVAIGVLALGVPHASGAAAPKKDEGGPARVVIPASSGNVPGDLLTSGTAATKWTLALPQGASCSGDTATNNFHIFTYVVPSSVDPATLHFGGTGGAGGGPDNNPQAFPLVDDGGSPFIAGNTGIGTGQVLPVPFTTLQWGNPPTPFDSTLIPPGTYNLGVACADGTGANDKFWNVQETFSGDPTVFSGPNAFAWTVVGAGPTGSTSSTTPGASTSSTTPGASTSSTIRDSSSSTSSTSSTVVGGSTTSTTVGSSATGDPSSGGSSSGGSSSGDSSSGGSSSGGLAFTGASVTRVGGLGLLLFAFGWGADVVVHRRRSQRREP